MINPLPDIDSVYSMLIHDEQQSELQSSLPSFASDSVSFSATGTRKPYPSKINFDGRKSNLSFNGRKTNFSYNQSQGLFCTYCKKLGHTIRRCRKLHNYPLDYQQFFRDQKSITSVQPTDVISQGGSSLTQGPAIVPS